MCHHLPYLVPPERLLSEHSTEGLWMPWHGFDAKAAIEKMIIRTDFDMVSVFLQVLWTLLTISHRLNVYSTDLHAYNILIETAPFNGYYAITFNTTRPTKGNRSGASHVTTLRTRLKVTLVDWALVSQASMMLPLQAELKTLLGVQERAPSQWSRSRSRSTSNLNRSLDEDTEQSNVSHFLLMNSAWKELCAAYPMESSEIPINTTLGKRKVKLNQLLVALPGQGAQIWFGAASALDGTNDGYQRVSVESNFTERDAENILLNDFSLKAFEQREFLQWYSDPTANIPDLQLPLSSSPPETSLPLPNKKKRGRPCLEAAPQSSTERTRRWRARQAKSSSSSNNKRPKLREADISATIRHTLEKESFIEFPYDSPLIKVLPSKLHVKDAGLGVFAATHIKKGDTITYYEGISITGVDLLPKKGDFTHTHLISLTKGTNSTILDGIRFPQLGKGVASLVNSCRGTDKNANVCLEVYEVAKLPKGRMLVALRDIESDEELLADYEPL